MRTKPQPASSAGRAARMRRRAAIVACQIPVCTSCTTMALDDGFPGGRSIVRTHVANRPNPVLSAYQHMPDRLPGLGGQGRGEPVMIQPVTVAIVVAFAVANGDLDRPGISAVERVGLGPAWVPGFPVLCLETRIARSGIRACAADPGPAMRPRLRPRRSASG
jgi:hypothetical protein